MFRTVGHFFLTEDELVRQLKSDDLVNVIDWLVLPHHGVSTEEAYAIYAKDIGRYFAHGITAVEQTSGIPFPSGDNNQIEAHGTRSVKAG